MKVREFLVKIPGLCGAKNAERIASIFGYVFDCELQKGTPFDRNDYDKADFGNRSRYLWDMLYADEKAHPHLIEHCERLVEIIERSHYLDEHGEKFHAKTIDALYQRVKQYETETPEISAVLSADDAITMARWNG